MWYTVKMGLPAQLYSISKAAGSSALPTVKPLRLGVAAVIDDRSLGLDPDETSILRQHPILSSDRLSLAAQVLVAPADAV